MRLGKDLEDDEDVAIKLESSTSRVPMLSMEFNFYKLLGHQPGLPRVYHFGSCGKYSGLVMELLGPNLEELFLACNKKFSFKTILMIAIQLLERIEVIHAAGIIYRDVKPENCLIGPAKSRKVNSIYIVDLGLAKKFVSHENGGHIPFRENKSLTGTVRYMSTKAHQGKEQSRRDDLESLGYVFFYFLTGGKLPWQGIKCDDIRKRYHIIGHIKEETSVQNLGRNYPWEFTVYLRYCRGLKFQQIPDYNYLKRLFKGCLVRLNKQEDYVFDWMDTRYALMAFKVKKNKNSFLYFAPHRSGAPAGMTRPLWRSSTSRRRGISSSITGSSS